MWPLYFPEFPLLTYIPETNTSYSENSTQTENLEESDAQIQQSAQEIFFEMPELNKELSSPKTVIHVPFKKDSPVNNNQKINGPEIDKVNSAFTSIVPITPRQSLPLQSPRSLLGFSEQGRYYSSNGNLIRGGEVPEDKTFMFSSSTSKLDPKFVDDDGILTDAFFSPPDDLAEADG